MGLSRGNTSTFVLLVLYCGCMSGGFRIVPLQNYASSLTLEATSRVDFKVLRRCNEGGLSSKPIAVSPSVTCPCFLEYQFFPDVPSVWDVYFLAEADAVRWAATGYRDDPTSYISKYSAVGVEAAGGGDGQGLQQNNVLLEGIFRLVFRARAIGTVCFSELDGTNDARPTNFYVFESMPSPCPVVVPDVSAEQRIVGGTEAAAVNGIAKYFPWIAVIWQGTRRSICGGSHIAPGYVLTAAHCQIQKDISAFNVRIGNEVYDAGQQYSISKIWVHEEYKLLDSGEAINDIAILQIKNLDPSKVNDTVVLNTNTSIPRAGQYMTTAGYGHLSEGWAAPLNPHRLRKVDVPMWSIQDCSRVFSKVDPKMHICAGVKTGGCDSCQADSGGPLRYIGEDENGIRRASLVGIVSFGAGCAEKNMPGIYTNVATFAPWIRNIIAGDKDSQATSTAASKPEIISSTWGIALLASIACLCVLLAAGLVVAFARRKGSARDGEIEEGGEPSDVPSTSGIST